MRDRKLIFHYKAAPTAASAEVDTDSSQPGVGTKLLISATLNGATATVPVTCTVSSSDTKGGTAVTTAVFTIPAGIATEGGVILSSELPSHTKRFVTTSWSGLSGGELTDGLDHGLADGLAATHPR